MQKITVEEMDLKFYQQMPKIIYASTGPNQFVVDDDGWSVKYVRDEEAYLVQLKDAEQKHMEALRDKEKK